MKKLLVLGAGTAGTMVVNKLRKRLDRAQWQITVVDQDPIHYYQPGYLLMPFGMYDKNEVVKPKGDFIPAGVEMILCEIDVIEPDKNLVRLSDGRVLPYDFLVIATGAHIRPDQTPGLLEDEWGKSIQNFYTYEGAIALAEKFDTWQGGRLVVNVVENPIKCPVAPLEFLMLADWFFHKRGIRDRVELIYATPLPGAFTKPVCSERLGGLLEQKGIKVETEFMTMEIQPNAKKVVSYDEREVEYDLLVSVPVNMGAEVVGKSGLGGDDGMNYVPVDKHTFLATAYPNIFALGDAAAVPASKAGSVAHFAVDGFAENFVEYVKGHELKPLFDGHANCFIESGYGKGLLIDFNYTTEPLPGSYPLPVVGPFPLLQESKMNHFGKLMFKWMYWNILLKGVWMPLPANMSMVGKRIPHNSKK